MINFNHFLNFVYEANAYASREPEGSAHRELETIEAFAEEAPDCDWKHHIYLDILRRAGIEQLGEPFTRQDLNRLERSFNETYLN